MDQAMKTFPDGLPNLAQLATYNKGKDVPVETSWIWGSDDEAGGRHDLSQLLCVPLTDKDQDRSHQSLDTR
jgi:hypothetical protein